MAVLAGLVAPLAVALVLVPFRSGFPGMDAALVLILVVVAVGANGYRLAGAVAAVSAAAWFDFFLLLLAVGVAVTEIAVWGRRQRQTAARRAGYLEGINAAARAVATGGSPAALPAGT